MLNSKVMKKKDFVIGHPPSTYQVDFKNYDANALQFCYKPSLHPPKEEAPAAARPYIPVDNQNLRQFKQRIPFDLLWADPKPILRTRPADSPKPWGKVENTGRAHAQATRPRVVLTPAVAVDDIDNEDVRKSLMKATYSSTAHKAMVEAMTLAKYNNLRAPLPGYSSTNPVILHRVAPPLVSPEWRRETVPWDGKQPRGAVNVDYEFWKKQNTYKCRPQTVAADGNSRGRNARRRTHYWCDTCVMSMSKQATKLRMHTLRSNQSLKPPNQPKINKELKVGTRKWINNENLQPMTEVPFDLTWETEKKVTRIRLTNEPQLHEVEGIEDPGRKHAQATRPRIIMTPAITVDDIENQETRDAMMKEHYASSTHLAMQEALTLAKYNVVKAPLSGFSRADPLSLAKLNPRLVSTEWRRDSVSWDSRQIRSLVEPSREFWTNNNPYSACPSCKETAQVAKLRKSSNRF